MSAPDTGVTADTEISFRVQLPAGCPLNGRTGTILAARPHFVDTVCRCEFVLRPDDGTGDTVVLCSSEVIDGSCVCRDVQDRGTIPIFERVDGETLSVSSLLNARDDAYALYEKLQADSPDVEIVRIVSTEDDHPRPARVPVDTSELTRKQRRALELAICEGYYHTPRAVDLETLAKECDISRQAFSHRLRQAEETVMEQICPDEVQD